MADREKKVAATGEAGEEVGPGQVAPPEAGPEHQVTTQEVLAAFDVQLEEITKLLATELVDNLTEQRQQLSEQAVKLSGLLKAAKSNDVDQTLLDSITECISLIDGIRVSAADAKSFADTDSNENFTSLETLRSQIETPRGIMLTGNLEQMELQMLAIRAEGELRKNSSPILAEALGAINTIKGIYARAAELEKRKAEVEGFRDSFTAVEKGLIEGVKLADTVEKTNAGVDAHTRTIHELRSAIFQLVLNVVDNFTAGKAATERDMTTIKQDLDADSKVIKATLSTLLEGIRTGDWEKLKGALTTLGVFTNERYSTKISKDVAAYEAAQASNSGEAFTRLASMRDGVQLGQALGTAHIVIAELKMALAASQKETTTMYARATAAEARVAKLAAEAAVAPALVAVAATAATTGEPAAPPASPPSYEFGNSDDDDDIDSWVVIDNSTAEVPPVSSPPLATELPVATTASSPIPAESVPAPVAIEPPPAGETSAKEDPPTAVDLTEF